MIHISAETGIGWYETDRGVLKASDQAVSEALTHDDLIVLGPQPVASRVSADHVPEMANEP